MKTIRVDEIAKISNPIFIDVRSPGEYAEGTIPGAVNIPIFTDEQRVEIGTTYKQESPEQARELGLEYVAPLLPDLVNAVKKVSKDKTPIIFCWRGGSRSESLCQILSLMRIGGYRLEGGYKAYRQYIIDQLASYTFTPEVVVLHGYTGSGKTQILHRLREEGEPVMDLEGLAGHRGSAFGSIGIKEVRNQKVFDSLLYLELEGLKEEQYVLMEAESKRIGRVNMPDFLFEKKQKGLPILVQVSLETRVERILAEYAVEGITKELIETTLGSLRAIEKKLIQKIGKVAYEELEHSLLQGDLRPVIRTLLVEYYDPLYQFSQDKYSQYDFVVNADNLSSGVQAIKEFLKSKYAMSKIY